MSNDMNYDADNGVHDDSESICQYNMGAVLLGKPSVNKVIIMKTATKTNRSVYGIGLALCCLLLLLGNAGEVSATTPDAGVCGFGNTGICDEGQVLNPDTCTCSDPAPEMSVMMLPVALAAAGFLAVRARRKGNRKDAA
jgi:hypothetical protein